MALPNGTDTRTALALVLSSAELSSLRSQYDRAFPRWPNHVNVIFPFVGVERFPEMKGRLEKALGGQAAVPISFSTLGSFPQQHGTATYHIRVDGEEIKDLWRRVSEALPDVPVKHASFQGHLTLGQGGPALQATIAQAVAAIPEKGVTVRSICLLARSGQEPFKIVEEVTFGEDGKGDAEKKEDQSAGSPVAAAAAESSKPQADPSSSSAIVAASA